jgi:threonylcarbamoyladenosine tRNA methylthiotransferase MtaB
VQSRRYILRTLGCKANVYDSRLLESELQKNGWSPGQEGSQDPVSLCIVNSCTVTDEADRQSRKMASRLARVHPGAKVVITGCAAEVEPERLAASKGIHYVIGNQDKPKLVELVLREMSKDVAQGSSAQDGVILGSAEAYDAMVSRHPLDREWPGSESLFNTPQAGRHGQAIRTRMFLKIQEGCNAFCTYCVIPYGRGPSRSLAAPKVIEQIRELVSQGVHEVVLTGTNLGDYGVDWGADQGLEDLIKQIFKETALERLRVSSLDPVEISPGLTELMQEEPRFCPHFHVSLQSAHPRILKLMKRKYSMKDVQESLERIARVKGALGGVFVGMDVITGFPGETEQEFQEAFESLSSLPWHRLHVFPYSERSGTPATRLPASVPLEARQDRARRLRALSLERLTQSYQGLLDSCLSSGSDLQSVLIEGLGGGVGGAPTIVAGYTSNYYRAQISLTGPQQQEVHSWVNQLKSFRPDGLVVESASGDVSLIGTFF